MGIKYTKGYKYKLEKEYKVMIDIKPAHDIVHPFMELTKDGFLTIKHGYSWDGASGPAIDTKTFMRGSLVHDALYQMIRERYLNESYRMVCDCELRKICKQDGMSSFRAWYVYEAVRKFGSSSVEPREIYTAP